MTSLFELERLDKSFFMSSTISVAKNLLGKYLIKNINGKYAGGMIVETEAYIGPYDDAAHSFGLKKTKKNEAMYEEGGTAYVYQIYGIHFCFNVVTNQKDKPEAVLIRAVQPDLGIDIMQNNRNKPINNLTNGPAKLCQALGIDLNYNKISLLSDKLFIAQKQNKQNFKIESSKRINIEYAKQYKDKLWRFYIKDNPFVSK